MNSRGFSAPWSCELKVASCLLGGILLCLPLLLLARGRAPWPARVLVGAAGPLIVLPCALFTVRGYRLERGSLFVQRLLWETRLEFEGLRSVETIPQPAALKGAIRVCGNGGLFSFSGWYRSRQLGFYRAWLTDWNRAVVLRFPRRTWVISPDDPVAFVETLRRERKLV